MNLKKRVFSLYDFKCYRPMIGYVAKDRDREIYLHIDEPIYDDDAECWFSSPEEVRITTYFPEFENMNYTDKPIKVKIKLEKYDNTL